MLRTINCLLSRDVCYALLVGNRTLRLGVVPLVVSICQVRGDMQRRVTKAVFPVAGLGTRFLPATKSVPKEILPLVDKPLIQYAIDEARAAGITEFIFVTSRGKSALEDYFDRSPELEASLRDNGKHQLLESLRQTDMGSGAVAYVRQHERLGLGHAVWCARRLIGDEPFAVMLPDDIIDAETPCLQQMVEAYAEFGGNMVATMEVPRHTVSSYGIVDVARPFDVCMPIRGMVEKPAADSAPSNLAIIGRYILEPRVLCHLNEMKQGAGGEIQLTDAIAMEIAESDNVHAFRFAGRRYDCGSKAGYLQATVAFGLAREDLRDEFLHFLRSVADSNFDQLPEKRFALR
jgi:UTP--glucose-1-phosphate uridylyltransferase